MGSHGVNRALPVLLSHGEGVAFGGGGSRLFYHVIARGNERKAVFRDDRDRQEYLDRLIRCRERFGLRVLAFCLMGNHLHLAVERGPTKLSRVMLALQSAYTQCSIAGTAASVICFKAGTRRS
jgi:REP element-mobilizing transposase RayT